MRVIGVVLGAVTVAALNLILLVGCIGESPPWFGFLVLVMDSALLSSSVCLGVVFLRAGRRLLAAAFLANLPVMVVALGLRLSDVTFPRTVLFGFDLYWLNLYLMGLAVCIRGGSQTPNQALQRTAGGAWSFFPRSSASAPPPLSFVVRRAEGFRVGEDLEEPAVLRVLIVEDTPRRLEGLAELYREHAWVATSTAERAIRLVRAYDFDLISLDYDLEGPGDGADVAEAIAASRNAGTPVVVHSMNPAGVELMVLLLPHAQSVPVEPILAEYWLVERVRTALRCGAPTDWAAVVAGHRRAEVMQKVVTLYLSAWKTEHGTTEEHLATYLSEGWRVVSVTAAGGTDSINGLNTWVIVVMEK